MSTDEVEVVAEEATVPAVEVTNNLLKTVSLTIGLGEELIVRVNRNGDETLYDMFEAAATQLEVELERLFVLTADGEGFTHPVYVERNGETLQPTTPDFPIEDDDVVTTTAEVGAG